MKIVYWHEASGETEFVKKVSGLRAWKVYVRKHADHLGEHTLVRNGRTIRVASAIRHVTLDGQPKLFVYERAV